MTYLVICMYCCSLIPKVRAPRLCWELHTEHLQPWRGGARGLDLESGETLSGRDEQGGG